MQILAAKSRCLGVILAILLLGGTTGFASAKGPSQSQNNDDIRMLMDEMREMNARLAKQNEQIAVLTERVG